MNIPRLILAGLSGGAGKTIATLGLARALADASVSVKPFKKGPDYIDATWLGLAAGQPATNLDPFLVDRDTLRGLFAEKAGGFDLALVEGNRGLFDGKDVEGSCSTAELARQLDAPVVLVLDCTKMTRTAVAVLMGVRDFEPDLRLAGVILNRVAGARHEAVLRGSIERYLGLPVVGVLPKLGENPIPERHMGLISDREHDRSDSHLERLGAMAAESLDLNILMGIARSSQSLDISAVNLWPEPEPGASPVIGYVHDAALWFYYQENLEALERAGATLKRLSLLDETSWPELHGLYLGGGFPETLAPKLAKAEATRNRVRELARAGLPIYAECGGFMYLCESLEFEGRGYPMAGVFPLSTGFCPKPQGLGYVRAEVVGDNPFHETGTTVAGHEFHYSRCVKADGADLDFCLRMTRGQGMLDGLDGLVMNNVFASYTHIFALGQPDWAPNFVRAAQRFQAG